LESFRQDLYKELLARIQETSYSVPRFVPSQRVTGGQLQEWMYYIRMFEGKSYEVYCRAPKTGDMEHNNWDGTLESPILPGEQVILDVNILAQDEEYCVVEEVEVSPSHQRLGYSADFSGGEQYSIRILDLETNELVEDGSICTNTDGSIVWANDDDTYYYIKLDSALRPYQVYRRVISRKGRQEEDELMYEESDEMFWLGISKTKDGRFLLISSESAEASEVHFVDLKLESTQGAVVPVQCVAKRRQNVLYNVDHRHGKWWISSNVGSLPNMALFTAPAVADCEDSWKLVPSKTSGTALFDGNIQDRSLDDVECFDVGAVVTGREDGLPRLWFLRLAEGHDSVEGSKSTVKLAAVERLEFEEEAFDVGMSSNHDFYAQSVLIAYDSWRG